VSRTPAVAALVLALGLVGAGCGTGGLAASGSDKDKGRQLFTDKCGGCHTLASAGSRGTIGPNLDDAFAADRRQGFAESTIQQVVHDQIKFADPDFGMQPNIVRGEDAENVAAYVASVAGINGPSSGAPKPSASTDGKTIFKENCASCHTLADADAKGTIGPNLDQLKPPRDRVERQVINGGGAMPAFKGTLTDEQIKAVSTYVAQAAGK
jgi:cbb3-type cytochrome c oxidase subunit III